MRINTYKYLLKKSYQRFLSENERINKLIFITIEKTGITRTNDGVSYHFGEHLYNANIFISDEFELKDNIDIIITSPEIIGMLESGLYKSSHEIFNILVKNNIYNVLLQTK